MWFFFKRLISSRNVVVEYHKDGVTIKEAYMTDLLGRRVGLCERFYNNGKIKERCSYQGGIPVGSFDRYYSSGRLRETGAYDTKGRLTGEYMYYHPNGRILFMCNYDKGRRQGFYESRDSQGRLIRRCMYRVGKLDGDYYIYNKKGEVISHEVYHQAPDKYDRDQPFRQEICRLIHGAQKQMTPTPLRRRVLLSLCGEYRNENARD